MSDQSKTEQQLRAELQSLHKRLAELEVAEADVRESERKYKILIDGLNNPITVYGCDGVLLTMNAAAAEKLDGAPNDYIGKSVTEVHPSVADVAIKRIRLVAKMGESRYFETTMELPTGRMWFSSNFDPVRDASGNVTAVQIISHDITERKLAEQQILMANERLQYLLDSSSAVIYTAETSGNYAGTFIGRNVEQITGHQPDEFMNDKNFWYDHVHPEDRPIVEREVPVLFDRGRHAYEYRFLCKNGSTIWMRDEMKLVRDESGTPVEIVGFWIDITKLKKHEDEKALLQEQLLQSQKMEAIGTLAGGIAHDFNNLLTGMLGQAEILLRNHDPQTKAFNGAQVIQIAALRAAELTRQLLGFARKGKFEDRPVDVNGITNDAMAILKHTMDKRIVLECRLEQGASVVVGDPTQLQQVLMNLAVNAQDAMPNGGRLTIETRAIELTDDQVQGLAYVSPGRYLVASVSDTGVGIPEEIHRRIFEPFFTTKGLGEGTGMGLAMVHGIVKDHGGWIDLHSEAGKGATFEVYLPLAEGQILEPVKPEAPELARGEGRLLVVDDEEIVRDVAGGLLASLGYEAVCVCTGQEALDYYRENGGQVDLVLLDMIMPRMSGANCFRYLKKLDPNVKVLLLSGHVLSEVVHDLQAEGAMGFIRKPFTLQQLSRMVAEALAGGR